VDKAVIYIRVSTDEQDPKNQLADCIKYCKEKGWEILRIYEDKGISAYKENVRRPQFEQMLEDAKKREFQHIVVFDLDRFSRQEEIKVLEQIKTLRMLYGVEVNAVHGDEWRDIVDMINRIPDMGIVGKALADFLETLLRAMQARQARIESEKISRRVKASRRFQKAIKEGKVGRPDIYQKLSKKLRIPEQKLREKLPAKIVQMKDEQNMSYRQIARQLGIPKSTVEKIYKETIALKSLSKKGGDENAV